MGTTSPLVSFIVPAYNVERYIEKCISSIIHQDYHYLECIVIDDGSEDNTDIILDKICCNDSRIKVIHKNNEGVSAARNDGIDAATGDYLVFVDGDDYIAPDYTTYMLKLVVDNKADFGLSLNCFTRKDESQVDAERVDLLNSEDTTALLLGPRVMVGCWNKIYKSDFIKNNNLKFSPGLFYGEGLYFINQVAQRTPITAVGNRKVYYYRRNNKDSACSQFNIDKIYNGSKSIEKIESELIIKTPKVLNMLGWHRCQFKMGAVVRMKATGVIKDFKEYYRECLGYVRSHAIGCLFIKGVSLYKKGLLIGTAMSPSIMVALDNIRRKKIQNQSVD